MVKGITSSQYIHGCGNLYALARDLLSKLGVKVIGDLVDKGCGFLHAFIYGDSSYP